MAHYNKKAVVEALRSANLRPGDIVFGHSNIGFFGFPEEGRTPEVIVDILLDAFFDVIGDKGTLVLPAFTYSFPKGEIYDVQETPGIGGLFSEMIRKLPESIRSVDPSVSVVAIGAKAREITQNMPKNSYAEDGIFGRLVEQNAVICNMNVDIATTIIHYAEKMAGVPYRFLKTFTGKIRDDGQLYDAENSIFVSYKLDELRPAFEPFDRIANERNLYKKEAIGRGFVKVMPVKDHVELVFNCLESDPWFFTQAGVTGNIPDVSKFTDEYK